MAAVTSTLSGADAAASSPRDAGALTVGDGSTPSDGRDLKIGLAIGLALTAVALFVGPGQAAGRALVINALSVLIGFGFVIYARSRPGRHGVSGQWSVALFAGFVALSGFSITWSVEPAATWDEVNRLLGYLAIFTAAVVGARTFPHRWRSLLLGLAIASVLIALVALLSKVFPELLAPQERYARLREPLQYWNAVGLIGAFGVPLWLHFGTRRVGRPILDILSAPALTILFAAIMLAYSRGALIAAIVGVAIWLLLAPVRLRSVAALVVPIAGAAVIVLWAFGQTALTQDEIDLLQRQTAGFRFGVVIGVTLLVVTLLSFLTQFTLAAWGPDVRWRRRVGVVLLAAAALVPVAGAVALTQSERGLSGTISGGWTQLTDAEANTVPGSAPGNDPQRLAQVGNARSVYWRDALRVFRDQPVIGAGANAYGAARLRHRSDTLDVGHAHGFVHQVAADLGVVGLSLIAALLGAWAIAVARTIGGRGRSWPPERIGLIALLAATVTFGVHSTIDWTWSFPVATLPALMAAGWLAGRGSLFADPQAVRPRATELTAGRWTGVARWVPRVQLGAVVLLALWSIVTPYRAFKLSQEALAAVEAGDTTRAVELAERAVAIDDVSLDTHAALAAALASGADIDGARKTIEEGVRLQPQNPAAWRQLLAFELGPGANADRAAQAYAAARYLDPLSPTLPAMVQSALTAPTSDPALAPADPAAAPGAPTPDPAPTGPASGATAPAPAAPETGGAAIP